MADVLIIAHSPRDALVQYNDLNGWITEYFPMLCFPPIAMSGVISRRGARHVRRTVTVIPVDVTREERGGGSHYASFTRYTGTYLLKFTDGAPRGAL